MELDPPEASANPQGRSRNFQFMRDAMELGPPEGSAHPQGRSQLSMPGRLLMGNSTNLWIPSTTDVTSLALIRHIDPPHWEHTCAGLIRRIDIAPPHVSERCAGLTLDLRSIRHMCQSDVPD